MFLVQILWKGGKSGWGYIAIEMINMAGEEERKEEENLAKHKNISMPCLQLSWPFPDRLFCLPLGESNSISGQSDLSFININDC